MFLHCGIVSWTFILFNSDDYESFPNTSTTDDVDPEPAIKSSSQSDLLECYKHLLTPDPTLNPGTTFSDADVHVSEVKPTYKQFQNFYTLLNTVEKQGLHRPGMVKVMHNREHYSLWIIIYEEYREEKNTDSSIRFLMLQF